MVLTDKFWISKAALCTLMVHTSIAAFAMRRSRDVPHEKLYSSSTSVFLGELLKVFLSIYLHDGFPGEHTQLDNLEKAEGQKKSGKIGILERLQKNVEDIYINISWKMSIPAVLYVIQNHLQLHSIASITTVEYQALSQLKIIAIGVFSTLLLRKKLLPSHWLSMISLLTGVILLQCSKVVQKDQITALSHSSFMSLQDQIIYAQQSITLLLNDENIWSHLTGSASVVSGCIIGSYAGVFMEKTFKNNKQGLWSSNAQLSFFSLFPALALMLIDAIKEQNPYFLRNFGFWAWLTVIIRGLGGILVAIVLKHCDNISKAFATSSAIVLSMLINILWCGIQPNVGEILGAGIVISSSISYSRVGTIVKSI